MYLVILPFILLGLTAKIKNNRNTIKSNKYFELPSTQLTRIQEHSPNAFTGSLSQERAIEVTSK